MTTPHERLGAALRSHRIAREWAALAQPSIRLRHAGDGDPVVGHLAGSPRLPDRMPWPGADAGVPMTLLLTLDLAALPRTGLDLPDAGRLLFFSDGSGSGAGAVRYVPAGTGASPRPTPAGLGANAGPVAVTAAVETTVPAENHPYLSGVPHGYFDAVAGFDAADSAIEVPTHRIGGYGDAVQYEADFAPSSRIPPLPGDPDGDALDRPIMLAQIDTDYDAQIGWGDLGNSHWVIERGDLAARRFDRTDMFWSCF